VKQNNVDRTIWLVYWEAELFYCPFCLDLPMHAGAEALA